MPQVSVKMKVRGVWAENTSGQKETKVLSTARTEGPVKDWVPVHAEQEYVIKLEITKESFGFKVRIDSRTHSLQRLNIFIHMCFIYFISISSPLLAYYEFTQ